MTQAILCSGENRDSVVSHWLTPAADGQNCRGAQYRPLAIGPHPILYTPCRESRLLDLYAMFPNWNALRANLNRTLSPVTGHLGKGDGMAVHASEFNRADRNLYSAATDKESLSVQTNGKIDGLGYASADHFRGATKMIGTGNHRGVTP